jgi:hypothetical protein
MVDDQHDGKYRPAPSDAAGLIEYLEAAVPSARALEPAVGFFLQMAIKELIWLSLHHDGDLNVSEGGNL